MALQVSPWLLLLLLTAITASVIGTSAKDTDKDKATGDSFVATERALQKHCTGMCRLCTSYLCTPKCLALVLTPEKPKDPWMRVLMVKKGSKVWPRSLWLSDSKALIDNSTVYFNGSFINNWDNRRVEKIKVSFRRPNNQSSIDLIFSVDGTTKTSWFSKEHLLSAPWPDLMKEKFKEGHGGSYFSIDGEKSKGAQRRFYISSGYGGCNADVGWFVVLEVTGNCDWDKCPKYPCFKYTPTTKKEPFKKKGSGEADSFEIFAKYRE